MCETSRAYVAHTEDTWTAYKFDHWEDQRVDARIILNRILNQVEGVHWFQLIPVDCRKHCNELLGLIKCGEFIDQVSDC
jgi:hypothetical protein